MELGQKRLESFFTCKSMRAYDIPKYQRGYSWGKDQVIEFWTDLTDHDEADGSTHFFGTVYVSKIPNSKNSNMKKFRIVDGQQRITTSLILLICIRDYLCSIREKLNADVGRYIDDLNHRLYEYDDKRHTYDPNKLIITLSRVNKIFFETYIAPEVSTNEKINATEYANNDSDRNIAEAYSILMKFIQEYGKDTNGNSVTKLNHLMWTLFDSFKMIEVEVPDEIEAHVMFNLINNRGIGLDQSDLIKNLLFAELDKISRSNNSEKYMNDYDEKWTDLRNNITGKDYAAYNHMDDFFYYYLSIEYYRTLKSLKSKPKLNDMSKSLVGLLVSKKASTVIDELLDLSITFVKLRRPHESFEQYPNVQHYLKRIKDLDAKYVYPIMLLGYEYLWPGNKKEFQLLAEICFKYHVRVKSLGIVQLEKYRDTLQNIIELIMSKPPTKKMIGQIIDKLTCDDDSYPKEEKLRLYLEDFTVTASKLAIALLDEIERSCNKEKQRKPDVVIEHIMPRKISKEWITYIKTKNPQESLSPNLIASKYFNWLGNQTLLSSSKNTINPNKLFSEKKRIYKNDDHMITNELSSKREWTVNLIKERQIKLTNDLVKILDLTKL